MSVLTGAHVYGGCRTENFIELQVPPDAGNGVANAGKLPVTVWPINKCQC
jgi:hypothetical protein